MRETMRDRGKFWSPAPGPAAMLEGDGFSARRVSGLGQTLVSGDLDAAIAALAPGAREAGLWQVAAGESYSVRVARDRALLVTPSPLAIEPGWREGFVATPCDDAYAIIDIAGEALTDLIAEATSADLETGSRSAAVLFAGVAAVLYRAAPQAARLHVETSLAAFVWAWLERRR